MKSQLLLIAFLHVSLFVLEIQCKVYGVDPYDEYSNYGHVGGNHVVPVVNKVVDYYSKPQYAFGYEVDDYHNQLSHGRWEIRDGDVTQGQYRVLLPDGRIQIVSYIADKGGYRPTITYIGKGHHPPPPPAYAHVKVPHHHVHVQPAPPPQPHYVQEQFIPAPTPVPFLKSVPHQHHNHYAQQPGFVGGPYKLDLSPIPIQHGYANAYGNGGGGSYGDLLIYGPSSHEPIKIIPAKVAKKRALLYDRTLFRRDLPNSNKNQTRRIKLIRAKKNSIPIKATNIASSAATETLSSTLSPLR